MIHCTTTNKTGMTYNINCKNSGLRTQVGAELGIESKTAITSDPLINNIRQVIAADINVNKHPAGNTRCGSELFLNGSE